MAGPNPEDLVGATLGGGRWTVRQLADEDELGLTFVAWDAELEAEVLVRLPSIRLLADEVFVRLFRPSVEQLYTLQPGQFLPVIDVGDHDGVPVSVVQFTATSTLVSEISEPIPRSERLLEITAWLPTICAGLDELHALGMVHRDLRPGTLWRSSEGRVWLGDVSLTAPVTQREQQYGRQLTDTGLAFGSPAYMAPELIIGIRYNGAVDQYALAATLFELISGRPAFSGTSPTATLLAHSRDPVPRLADLVDVPEEVSEVLSRALEKEPSKRFPTCMSFAQAFVATVRGEPIPEEELQRAKTSGVFDLPGYAGQAGTTENEIEDVEVETLAESETPPPSAGSTRSLPRPPEVVGPPPSTKTLKEEGRQRRRRLVFLMACGLVALLGGGGWWFWSLLQPSQEQSAPPPVVDTRAARRRADQFKERLKSPLPPNILTADKAPLVETFKAIGRGLEMEAEVDEPALAAAGIDPQTLVELAAGAGTFRQALHQLINRQDDLRIMLHNGGKKMVLTTMAPSERGQLTGLPLGNAAIGSPVADLLPMPLAGAGGAMPTDQALEQIRAASRMVITPDTPALETAGIDLASLPPVEVPKNATAQQALAALSKSHPQLAAVINPSNNSITLTSKEAAQARGLTSVDQFQPARPAATPAAASTSNTASGSNPPRTAEGAAGTGATTQVATTVWSEPYQPPSAPIVQFAPDVPLAPFETSTNGLGQVLVLVNPGEYFMGAPDEDPWATDEERPEHLVKVTHGYWIGQTEVTTREFVAVMERLPQPPEGPVSVELPENGALTDPARQGISQVTWFDALEFCNRLSEREKLPPYYALSDIERDATGAITSARVDLAGGTGYRLPTEAEWELAARAGTRYPEEIEDPGRHFESLGWSAANSRLVRPFVGHWPPNRWGLVDMAGGLREWTFDSHLPEQYRSASLYDPVSTDPSDSRLVRGGSYATPPAALRSTAREPLPSTSRDAQTGFRIVRSAAP